MVRLLRALLLTLPLLPAAAGAQLSLGLRAGYALPTGDAYQQPGFGTFKQKDLAKSATPLQLDVSWRLTPAVSTGVYFSYAPGQVGTKLSTFCATPGSSCDRPAVLRYGAQAAYAFGPAGPVEPWLGLSAGVESASFKVKRFVYGALPGTPPTPLVADLDGTLRGWDAQLEAGADYRLGSSFLAGPYLSVGRGQYRVQHVTLSDQGTVAGGGVDGARSHGWVALGLRGRFDL